MFTTSDLRPFHVIDHCLVSLFCGQLIPRLKAEIHCELYGASHRWHPVPPTVFQSDIEVSCIVCNRYSGSPLVGHGGILVVRRDLDNELFPASLDPTTQPTQHFLGPLLPRTMCCCQSSAIRPSKKCSTPFPSHPPLAHPRRQVSLQPIASQLRHVPSPQPVRMVLQPIGQPCPAGCRLPGRQQPGHQAVNLVAGESHIPHQEAHQLGQG